MTKKASAKGEMRRRSRSWMEAGAFAALGSEGRLVAIYVLQMADWTTCEIVIPERLAADAMKTRKTTVRRGLAQMVEEGILEILRPGGPRKPTRYRLALWSRSVTTEVTPRDLSGHVACPLMVTPCDRRGYTPRSLRSRSVTSAVTPCDHHSVSSSEEQSSSLEDLSSGSGSPESGLPAVGEAR